MAYKRSHPAYRGPWRKVRRQVLERDNHTCQLRLPGCTAVAVTVDHIQPIALGGAWWEPANLRASCFKCNIAAGHKTRALLAGNKQARAAAPSKPSRPW